MTAASVEWDFGESDEDAIAWMTAPSVLTAYVDFRHPELPPSTWQRVTVVTPEWVRQRLAETASAQWQSWPPMLVVAARSLSQARHAIDSAMSNGGWRLVARNSAQITETDRRRLEP